METEPKLTAETDKPANSLLQISSPKNMPICKKIPATALRSVQERPGLGDHSGEQLMKVLRARMSKEEVKLESKTARDPELLLSSPNLPPHPLFYFL